MGFSNLAFFAACSGFGHSGGLCTPSSFDTLGCSSACCLFGLLQCALRGGIGFVQFEMPSRLDCLTLSGICCFGCCFGFCLRKKRLFPNLLGRTMSQLRAVLAARGREVTILRSMQIGPGVKNSHIFWSFGNRDLIGLICALRIHNAWPRAL